MSTEPSSAPLERPACSLTASERRVADHAVQGLTNREISETLWVTIKTVEWHLRNAYFKLGISSRQELAGALAREDSGAGPTQTA